MTRQQKPSGLLAPPAAKLPRSSRAKQVRTVVNHSRSKQREEEGRGKRGTLMPKSKSAIEALREGGREGRSGGGRGL